MYADLVWAATNTQSGISLSTVQLIIAGMSALGTGGVVAAIVNAITSRRKLGADATEIITKAASGVVENLNSDNRDLRNEVRELRSSLALERTERSREQDRFGRIVVDHTNRLQTHVAWDHMVRERLAGVGIDLPEPPPLYPPFNTPGDLMSQ